MTTTMEIQKQFKMESLSREELIKMVRKQMAMTMEAQKKFETAKEAEESAIRQAEVYIEYFRNSSWNFRNFPNGTFNWSRRIRKFMKI
jgi:hypothetical protein